MLAKLRALDAVARERGESLSRIAVKWLLRDGRVSSVLVGASSAAQLDENLLALQGPSLSPEELSRIEEILRMPD